MTDPEPIEQLIAAAEDLGVRITGVVPGVGIVYALPLGHPTSPEAHSAIDRLKGRDDEVVEAIARVTAERWAQAPWAIGS